MYFEPTYVIYPELQLRYGYGYAADSELDTDLSAYLSQEAMARGADGVYLFTSSSNPAP